MEEPPPQQLRADQMTMVSLLNNRVTRAILAGDTGNPLLNSSAMLPDPSPPQMTNSQKLVHELDPDGILDKNVGELGSFKRDGEAVDPCHTLSSSEDDYDGREENEERSQNVTKHRASNA
jgi:hypothetical protein